MREYWPTIFKRLQGSHANKKAAYRVRGACMKMISAGAGVGLGVKDYRVSFVFETDKALAHFLDSDWSGSGLKPDH